MSTFIGFSKNLSKKPERFDPLKQPMNNDKKPTCSDYRQEMMLLGLRRRLAEEDLSDGEKQVIEAEITRLENEMRLS